MRLHRPRLGALTSALGERKVHAVGHVTSPSTGTKPRGHAGSWLAGIIRAAGDRLFAAGDAEALRHGWQITRTRGGLGRRYHDPRYGALIACPRCDGNGGIGRGPCDSCDGTGRTTRAAACREGGQR